MYAHFQSLMFHREPGCDDGQINVYQDKKKSFIYTKYSIGKKKQMFLISSKTMSLLQDRDCYISNCIT